MYEIINISTYNGQRWQTKTRSEILDDFENLVYKSPEVFLALLTSCLTLSPIEIDVGTKQDLINRGLINKNGIPYVNVRELACRIARKMENNLQAV